ncbi:MAG: GMC family oxidoreductase [Hyphomicrobiales bacterium]
MTEICDYLVIGGGSAGCIVAKRLAERSRGRIILLEAGKSDDGDPAATDLARLDEQTSDYAWGFKASTIAGAPPELNYSRARILGGCANHNDCAFLRPPDSDFDEWQRLGAEGWGAAAMAPWFDRVMKTITVEPPPRHPLSRAFVEGAKELGLAEVDFRQGIREGAGWFPLNAKGRLRQSSSIAYLHPLAGLPEHLKIWTETPATRLIIVNGKAIGAETPRGRVHASRAVILTCGAIQTPQLLMVSGLGPAAHLREHGIEVIADLPHVGRHLRDHVAAPIVWEAREPVAPWEICPFEATMLMQFEPDAPAPDVLWHYGLRVHEKYGEHPRLAFDGPAVKASPNVTRARSEGSVTLTGPAMREAPAIDLNYFSDPYDMRILLQAMRFTRRLIETKSLQAVCKMEIHPGGDVRSDDEWASYIKDVCETVYHPCGTAAIGKVVDPDLKVKGIGNLSIADASIFPSLITVNINCAVMMAAEKAAELIAA